MVSTALWEQVSSLSLRDQFELADRIQSQAPSLPEGVLPMSESELRDLLARSSEAAAAHPEQLVTAEALVDSIRDELGL
ncbi:MAG: hypothetical protein LBK42_03285 [Propionibacteriaceae bacterium]|nr:hypothetical protein [Propionibacteriaceae bacterium]